MSMDFLDKDMEAVLILMLREVKYRFQYIYTRDFNILYSY